MQLIRHHWQINNTETIEYTHVISDENDLIYISQLNYTNTTGFMSLKARLNHSCRSSSAAAWPRHQRGRFPFQTGSKLIAIPTTQQLSWDESGMTSHWFSGPRSLGVRDAGRLLLDLKCWSHNDQCQTATSWLIWSAIFFFFPRLSSHDTWMWDADTQRPPVMSAC